MLRMRSDPLAYTDFVTGDDHVCATKYLPLKSQAYAFWSMTF